MTGAIETNTGQLSEADARYLVDQIRQGAEAVFQLVITAYQGRAWTALQYPSWDALCEAEFSDAHLRIPRQDRREVVASMTDAGMSGRAISAALGVSTGTISDDRAAGSGVHNRTPEPPVTWEADDLDAEVVDAELIDDDPPAPKPITGLDGKTYSRPEPKPLPVKPTGPGRSPFTGEFYDAVQKVRTAVNALVKKTEDDRYPRNADQVAATYRSDLIRAQDALAGVIEQLPTPGA